VIKSHKTPAAIVTSQISKIAGFRALWNCATTTTTTTTTITIIIIIIIISIIQIYTFLTLLSSLLKPQWAGPDSHQAPTTVLSKVNVFHTYRTMLLSQVAKESLHWRVSSVNVNTFKGINSSIQVEVLLVNLVYNCSPCQYQQIQRLRF